MMNIRWSVGTIIPLHDENVQQSSANSSQSDKKQGIVARTGDDCAQLSPSHTRLCPVYYPARADTIVCSGDKGGGVSKVY